MCEPKRVTATEIQLRGLPFWSEISYADAREISEIINRRQDEVSVLFEAFRSRLEKAEKAINLYGDSNNWSKPYIRQGKIGYQVRAPLHEIGASAAINYRKEFPKTEAVDEQK